MKMRKALAAFLAMICIVNCFGICTFGVSAEGTTAVYAETSATLKQGETGYAYINIENMQALATITVTVHFDPAKIRVTDAYNQVDCVMHDDVIGENYVQFTYLFNGEGSQDRTTLFFFYYDVLETAAVGTTYFDITISDACDIDLNELPIAGSRCSFRISERAEEKYCYIYADDYIYTSVQQEFTISYRVDSWDIASGVFAIHYDPELFECVGWSSGEMLENKLTDVNTALAGSVYVSFVGTEYSYTGNLGSVTFRTKKNVTQNADIQLTVTNFYDFDLNSIISNGHTANVEMQYDESYIEDAPKMSASAKFDAQTQQVTVQIHLDANSHLGAGDFVLKFDENVLNYYSLKKEFQPTFFLTNTQKVDQGELKFSIISTTDIITQEVVLTVIFDVIPQCQELNLTFELSGSNLANAMTESIMLNFVDTNLTIPMKQHSYTSVVTKPTCTEKGYTTHTCACGHSYVDSYVDATGHKDSNKDHSCDNGCGVYQGTHADGNDEDHLCDYGCGATLSDHSYSSEVTKPTCTDRGYTTHTCDCGHSYVDSYVDATGHKDSNKDHTCDNGCSVYQGTHEDGNDKDHLCDYGCGATLTDHSYSSEVTKPTCTEKGYTTHTCACGHSYVDSYVDATGHKDSNKDHSCDNGCGVYQGTHADGNDEDHLCDYGCGATLSDHSYSSEVTKPTCTDRGYTTHTCDCGHSYVDSYVDATGHKDSNKDHTCDTCGKENITDHDYVNGSCSYCGATDPTICIKGDLDLDGDVDAQDLTMLARHVAGIEQVASQALGNADVNNDGDIDANDLTMHARYIAGIITDWEQE